MLQVASKLWEVSGALRLGLIYVPPVVRSARALLVVQSARNSFINRSLRPRDASDKQHDALESMGALGLRQECLGFHPDVH